MEQNNVTLPGLCLAEEIRDIRLLQVTDCHILRDPQAELKGLNTRQSFERVFDAIQSAAASYDLLLATGDLSQDESAESYAYLAERLNRLGRPIVWIPGNHDDPETMRDAFRADNILPDKHLRIGNWQIVLLDSTVAGEVHGRVSETQLHFMREALQAVPQQHALVCLHHPAIPCGSSWLDKKSLLDAEIFRDAVCRHTNVRGVLWGHVHQQAHFRQDGIDWLSTPSTCIQFKPDSVKFALDDRPPGYRNLTLRTDGSIESEVIRVD